MRRIHFWLLITLCVGQAIAGAEDSSTSGIMAEEHEEVGAYLTDAEGRSLYLFTRDEQGGPSTCYEQCAENWPPLIIEGDAEAGEGTDASLLGTVVRDDGSTQVTYHGWPLYYFARDEAPGDRAGQGVGEVWYLVSPEGEAIGAADAEPSEDAASEGAEEEAPAEGADGDAAEEGAEEEAAAEGISDEVMAHGDTVYQGSCAGCHGEEGGGTGDIPRLARNSGLENESLVLRQILRGGDYMPAFGRILSDEEVASVATYIRNSWENAHGPITEEQVMEAR